MFKVKDVIEFLEGIKIIFALAVGALGFIIMGQAVEQQSMELMQPIPGRLLLICIAIVIISQLILWLIQFGSRDKPEAVAEKEVDSLFANIQQARECVTNAKAGFRSATRTLDLAHDALVEVEKAVKRERHN